MPKASAGILLYRNRGDLEVLLVHPGGPFWKGKHEGVWSMPKGEFDPASEHPLDAARREFVEETGQALPQGDPLDLGEVTQKAGKRVIAFAIAGDLDPERLVSNTFEIEWPPRSGRTAQFPEVDRAEWFTIAAARSVINKAQIELLDRLLDRLSGSANHRA